MYDTIGMRIGALIASLGIRKVRFAERIKVDQAYVTQLTNGKRNPSDRLIDTICREFNVNEAWLRTGEGEMFVQLPKNEALAAQIQEFLQGGTDSFRERLVSLLLRLTPEQWGALEGYARELTAQAAPTRTNTDIDQEAKTVAAAEAVEVFDQVYLEKKVGAESSASPSDTGGAAGEKMA